MIDWGEVYRHFEENRHANRSRKTVFSQEQVQQAICFFIESGRYTHITDTAEALKVLKHIAHQLRRRDTLYEQREREHLEKYRDVAEVLSDELDLDRELRDNVIVLQAESLIENELSVLHRAVFLSYLNTNMTQVAIARKVGVSPARVQQIIKDTSALLADRFAIPQESVADYIVKKRRKNV